MRISVKTQLQERKCLKIEHLDKQASNKKVFIKTYFISFSVWRLTSARQGTADGSVTDGSITELNVHERFATHSHEHPLLQTQL